MAIREGLFDSTTITTSPSGYPQGDKAETADFFADIIYRILGDGVSLVPTSAMNVIANTGMTVTVKAGVAFKRGYKAQLESDLDIPFTTSASEQIFYIGVRLDEAIGEFADHNVVARPTFVAEADLAFAKITIPANAVVITDEMIEDLRYNTTYCGFVDMYRQSLVDIYDDFVDALATAVAGGIPAHATNHAAGGSDPIDTDTAPLSGSTKPVQSGGVYSDLAGKADTSVIFDAVLAAADWGADCLNLFDEVWESGALAGSGGDEYSSTTRLRSSNYVTISGGAIYHVQNSLGVNVQIFWWNGSTYLSYNDMLGGNSSVTAPASATRARLVIVGSTTISPADSGWTMFVAGAVGKPYEPQGKGIHLKASDYSDLSGVTATSVQELLPSRYGESTPNQREKLREALLYDGFQTAGTEIVYIADGDVPDEDIPVRIIMRGDL